MANWCNRIYNETKRRNFNPFCVVSLAILFVASLQSQFKNRKYHATIRFRPKSISYISYTVSLTFKNNIPPAYAKILNWMHISQESSIVFWTNFSHRFKIFLFQNIIIITETLRDLVYPIFEHRHEESSGMELWSVWWEKRVHHPCHHPRL